MAAKGRCGRQGVTKGSKIPGWRYLHGWLTG
jgi:hypothetical protein